jgi:transaldolase
MPTMHDLAGAGQSVWLDFIRRDLLEDGSLQALVDDGLRGMTSNPTIFQKAIADTDLYDRAIAEANGDAAAVFESLAIDDIRAAADILRPVHDATGGGDGYVSLEVPPDLAYDAETTIAEAKRLWAAVDRPNIMIKVPSTEEGVAAFEELTAAGINANATLMFGLDDYEAIALAYVRGAERAEHPERLASVASFFVSRVDTKVDAALEKEGSPEALAMLGTAAIANAKLAYQRYREIFEGDSFAAARGRGAAPQRPLWASTSTKNPLYPDLLYVDGLVGANTVNTMPPPTLEAFLDHGRVDPDALTTGVDAARAQIAALGDVGVDFDAVTDELQTEGVEAFANSYNDLLAAIDVKLDGS